MHCSIITLENDLHIGHIIDSITYNQTLISSEADEKDYMERE